MIHHKIIHHVRHFHHQILPHIHEDGKEHHAHGLSLLALFLYLQVFVISGVGFYIIKTHAPAILGAVTFSADQIISLTNQKRAENGLPALAFNGQLAQAAAGKASNMFAENYWAHFSPSGKTPWMFIAGAGYKYVYAGENLARDFNDAQSVVNAWMNSPSHRSNLLDKNFKEIGVAVADGKLTGVDGILVVQMFGTPVSGVPAAPTVAVATPSPAISPKPVANASVAPRAVASPVVSPSPTPLPVESPAVPLAQNSPIIIQGSPAAENSQAIVLGSRQFSIAKAISFGLVSFVFGLFTLEVILVVKKKNLHLRSGIIAHLGILALVLFAIWYAVSGAIL